MHPQPSPAGQISAARALRVSRPGPRHVLIRYLLDLAILLLSLLAARWLRLALPLGRPLDAEGVALYAPMLLLALVVWSVSLATARVYAAPGRSDVIAELQATAAAVTVATLVYAGLLYLSYRGLSRLLYGYFYLLDLTLTVSAHYLWRRHERRHSLGRRRLALIGTSPEMQALARTLARPGQERVTLLGFISEQPGSAGAEEGSLPVLGDLSAIAEIVARQGIDELLLGDLRTPEENEALLHTLQALPVALTLVPRTSELVLSRARVETLGDLVLVTLNAPVIAPLDRALKRAMDLTLSVILLVILAPLLAAVALAVLADSGRPVLYRSTRLGEGEQPFEMLKFRTMVPGAERQQEALISTEAPGEISFAKRRDDPRVTRVGRVLRRWSLDELPQLVNVLRGEMSLVGPRPELPALAAHYAPWQRRRFSVPQGITGWWQISGRSDRPKALHVADDLHYIRNYSLLLDLEILWRTVGAVLRGRGAY